MAEFMIDQEFRTLPYRPETAREQGWSEQEIKRVFWKKEDTKGGPGSGHHGHAGVPGKRGGSAPGGGGEYGVGTPASDTDAGINKLGVDIRANTMFSDGLSTKRPAAFPGTDIPWVGVEDAELGQIKNGIVTELSEETGTSYENINAVIGQWALSSNDTDMRSLAIQQDASKEFGVPLSDFAKGQIEKIKANRAEVERAFEEEWSEESIQAKVESALRFQETEDFQRTASLLGIPPLRKASREEHEASIRASKPDGPSYSERLEPLLPSDQQRHVLRQMYNDTQRKLATAGFKIGDTIRLYRGTKRPLAESENWNSGDIISVRGNAIESWSLWDGIAKNFAVTGTDPSSRSIVIEMNIPIERILSTARTGFGCLNEGEFVILGGITDEVSIGVIE